MLIVLQKPDAAHVAGFHTWHKLGRHVRKGEKGITIFAPILQRQKEAENGTAETSEELLLGYRTYAVFDVSQTEGKPLPSIAKVQGDARHYGEKLAAFTLSLGIRLEYSAAILPARGTSEGGKITLLPDLDSAEHAAVLAHELAHEFLHHQPRRAATTKELIHRSRNHHHRLFADSHVGGSRGQTVSTNGIDRRVSIAWLPLDDVYRHSSAHVTAPEAFI